MFLLYHYIFNDIVNKDTVQYNMMMNETLTGSYINKTVQFFEYGIMSVIGLF